MKKEIAIIKNGFDILRIIEGKNDKIFSDKENCLCKLYDKIMS